MATGCSLIGKYPQCFIVHHQALSIADTNDPCSKISQAIVGVNGRICYCAFLVIGPDCEISPF